MFQNRSTSRRNWLKPIPAAAYGLIGPGSLPVLAQRPSGPPKLKITDIKSYRLKTGQILVEVFTDSGITGMGECSPTVNIVALSAIIENQIKRIAVGRSPFDTEIIWNKVYQDHYKHGHQGVIMFALAGVDIALWDVMGKALGVPCYMMMGGKVRERVPLYASAMRMHRSPADEVKHLQPWIDRGFTAVKVHPFEFFANDQGKDDTLDVVRAVREAFGPKIRLFVDMNHAYTVHRAIQIGRELEKLGVNMFEEPISPDDYEGYSQLCAALDVPVSAGEESCTRWQHRDLITYGKVDIIQPDVSKCGGLTEIRKIGVLAGIYNKPVVTHNTQPTLCTAAHWHFWVSEPMCLYEQEYNCEVHALRDKFQLLKEPLQIEKGFLTLPDKPGLGVEVDRKVLEQLLA
jgi:D-arabinonate dehydratase/D-galactarolactone cycloisomerase